MAAAAFSWSYCRAHVLSTWTSFNRRVKASTKIYRFCCVHVTSIIDFKRTLAAGTYILKGELINQQPAMSIYYSLYSNLGYEFSKGIINGQYRIGPGVTGPNPFEVSFTLNEEQEVVLIMNSAYYGSPNNLKIDLIEWLIN